MTSDRMAAAKLPDETTGKLLDRFGCEPVSFTGTGDALYERHLLFDNIVNESMREPLPSIRHGLFEHYDLAVAVLVRDRG